MTPARVKQHKESKVSTSVSRSVSTAYPFAAIVGQDEMKLALILNVIDPLIGGVLVMGHRGTGKSTAVRGLADLLPHISVVTSCSCNCDPTRPDNLCAECAAKIEVGERLQSDKKPIPVVELPLGATEDRVCGTVAIERALREGVKTFEPGLLARVNRGFLYIDEVNLLEDHLVDLLLDVAASGRNHVEREGVSITHPANFVLIGSGNPEEGELRPQLLDRFGLHAEVVTTQDLSQRLAVLERREAFDRDPEAFRNSFALEQAELRNQITNARKSFTRVRIDDKLMKQIVELCVALQVDGHRGELTIMRAARALAAFKGKKKVTASEVTAVAAMSLRHRLRRDVLEGSGSSDLVSEAVNQSFREENATSGSANKEPGKPSEDHRSHEENIPQPRSTNFPSPPASGAEKFRFDLVSVNKTHGPKTLKKNRGRHEHLRATAVNRGRHIRSVVKRKLVSQIAIAATIRAVASGMRNSDSGLSSEWLRYKLFRHKRGTLFIFLIDASGSMAMKRIALAKRVMTERLRQSYINRDHIAIISFRGAGAELALPPSRSISRARGVIDSLMMGGGTPIAAGLARTLELLRLHKDSDGDVRVLLFTDGRANVPLALDDGLRELRLQTEIQQLGISLLKTGAHVAVIDTQAGFESKEATRSLARLLNAQFVTLSA